MRIPSLGLDLLRAQRAAPDFGALHLNAAGEVCRVRGPEEQRARREERPLLRAARQAVRGEHLAVTQTGNYFIEKERRLLARSAPTQLRFGSQMLVS